MTERTCFNCRYSLKIDDGKVTHTLTFRYQDRNRVEYGCMTHMLKRREYLRSMGVVVFMDKINTVTLLWR